MLGRGAIGHSALGQRDPINGNAQGVVTSGSGFVAARFMVSLVSGVATGSAAATGHLFTETVSLLPGVATGSAAATGHLLTETVSLLAGAAAGGAVAAGATIDIETSLVAGEATGGALTSGDDITVDVGLTTAGEATGTAAGEAPGDAITVTLQLLAGSASGATVVRMPPAAVPLYQPRPKSGRAEGALLTVEVEIFPGEATGFDGFAYDNEFLMFLAAAG